MKGVKMEKRRKISIFLASSIEEFKEERDALELFIRNISDRFEERYNVKIMPLRCENVDPAVSEGRKQDEYNELIRESEMCFFLFFTKAGDYTQEEFKTALKSFRESGKPKVYTYFKNVHEEDSVEDSVKEFMKKLDVEFSHFYSFFDHIDTIKLRILLNLKIQEMDFISVEFEDGICLVDGEETLSVEKVSEFENSIELKRLRKELAETEEKYYKMRAHYDERSGEQEFFHEYVNVASARENLIKVIEELEKSIFDMSMRMCKDEVHGNITQRQREAYKLFSEGDLEGANNVLDFYEIKSEYQRKQAILKQQEKKNAKVYIGELRQKIEILKALANTSDRFSEIEEVYEEAVSVSEEYLVEIDVIYDYAKFLYEQNKHKKALEVAERLEKLYTNENIEDSEYRQGYLYMLLCSIMSNGFERMKEAEKYLIKALEIFEKLRKTAPEVYSVDLAISYSNAGSFYAEHGQQKKAETYFFKALKIRKNLAVQHPEKYICDLSRLYTTIGWFCYNEEQPERAEKYFLEAVAKLEEYDQENANTLMALYMDVRNFYSLQEMFQKANNFYLKMISTMEKLAEKNPQKYREQLVITYKEAYDYFYFKQPMEAEKYILKVIELLKKLVCENSEKYRIYLEISYGQAGVLYSEIWQIKEAEKYIFKSIEGLKECASKEPEKYSVDLAVGYSRAGLLYQKIGDIKKAEFYFIKALAIRKNLAYENLINIDWAMIYELIGGIYLEQDQMKKAEKCLLRAIKIREALVEQDIERYSNDLILRYNTLSSFYLLIGSEEEEEKYFLKTIEIKERLAAMNPQTFNRDLINGYNSAIEFYSNRNMHKKRENFLLITIEKLEEFVEENPKEFNLDLINSYSDIINFYFEQEDLSKEEEYCIKIIEKLNELVEQNPVRYVKFLGLYCFKIALLYFREGQLDKAEKYFLKSIEVFEILAKENPSQYNKFLNDCKEALRLLRKERKKLNKKLKWPFRKKK